MDTFDKQGDLNDKCLRYRNVQLDTLSVKIEGVSLWHVYLCRDKLALEQP